MPHPSQAPISPLIGMWLLGLDSRTPVPLSGRVFLLHPVSVELTSIYGLVDRRAPELVWYVGKADNVKKRMKQHRMGSSGCNKRVRDWTRRVRKLGIKVLEEVDATKWEKAERRWIRVWRRRNPGLLNNQPGGKHGPLATHSTSIVPGQRFGRWTVLRKSKKFALFAPYWKCKCDCGTKKAVQEGGLGTGSNSCGCLKKELASLRGKARIDSRKARAARF